jgi:hypothetical protein
VSVVLALALLLGPVELPPPETPPPAEVPPPEADPVAIPPALPTEGTVGIELDWRAPADCPAPDRVVDAVAALLERDVAIEPTSAFVVRGEIGGANESWWVILEVDGPRGTERRRLDAPSCALATDAASLVIATNIDPAAVARTLEREPPKAEPKTPTRDRTGRTPPMSEVQSGPRKIGVALSLLGGPVLGLTPKVSGWLQGGLGVSIGRAVVGAYAGHAFARRASGDATLRSRTTTGGVRGCFAPTQGRLAVPLCALVELGVVHARAEGDTDRVARALYAGAGGGVAIEVALHQRIALTGGVDALVAITRPELRATGGGESTTYRVAPAAVRASLGIAVRLR